MGFPPTLIPTNKKKESENPKPEKKKKTQNIFQVILHFLQKAHINDRTSSFFVQAY